MATSRRLRFCMRWRHTELLEEFGWDTASNYQHDPLSSFNPQLYQKN